MENASVNLTPTSKDTRPLTPRGAWVAGFCVALPAAVAAWLTLGGMIQHARSTWVAPFSDLTKGHTYAAHSEAFKQQIEAAFPVGSPVAAMVRTLSQQGFREDGGALYADRGAWICTETFRVDWTEANGAIARISGQVRPSCL